MLETIAQTIAGVVFTICFGLLMMGFFFEGKTPRSRLANFIYIDLLLASAFILYMVNN